MVVNQIGENIEHITDIETLENIAYVIRELLRTKNSDKVAKAAMLKLLEKNSKDSINKEKLIATKEAEIEEMKADMEIYKERLEKIEEKIASIKAVQSESQPNQMVYR